jgi:hypothetical protein
MTSMKRFLPLLVLLSTGTVVLAAPPLRASSEGRYLHVKVNNLNTHELVRVNIPLSLAEKVIPAINHGQLQNGKVHIGNFSATDLNLKLILDALKSAPEGEFVTVQNNDSNVRVAKERGRLLVHVTDKNDKQTVDVTIPWEVAQALASETDHNELNVEAAIRALESAGDVNLVTVTDHDQTVRVWVDSNSATE